MSQQITYEISEALQPLPQYEWELLFPGHPDSAALIDLMGASGMDGFELRSIVARVGNQPALVLPVFLTHYSIASTLDGAAKRIAFAIEKLIPQLLRPKVLGVGFVEGEWGQIGVNPHIDASLIDCAYVGALDFLEAIAETFGAQLIAFKDFSVDARAQLPDSTLKRFATAESLPYCQLPITFASLDDYLNGLPRKVRQDLNRKRRQSQAVQVQYTTDVQPWIDVIYALYESQLQRTDLSFGKHNRLYFSEICRRVDGAKYILFFLDDRLIGFNLIVEKADMLVDKYIGIDPQCGRDNNIYFLAFLEKIRYCTTHGIKLLHLGAAAEAVKVRMGAYTFPTCVMFHHRNPLLHWALKKMIGALAYKPEAIAPPLADSTLPQALPNHARRLQPENSPCPTVFLASP